MAEELKAEDMAAIAASDPMIDQVAAFFFARSLDGYNMMEDIYWKDLPDVRPPNSEGMIVHVKANYRRDAQVLLKFLRAENIAPAAPEVIGASRADRLALQGMLSDMERLAARIKANPFFHFRGEPQPAIQPAIDRKPQRYPRIDKLGGY